MMLYKVAHNGSTLKLTELTRWNDHSRHSYIKSISRHSTFILLLLHDLVLLSMPGFQTF